MYQVHKFMLTPNQLKKVKKALDEDKQCSLTIPHDKFSGDHPLPVTETELKHVQEGDGYVSVSLSKKKLNHIRDHKEGGFLPLLALLPLIAKGIGVASALATGGAAIAGAVNSKKSEDAKLEEIQRHNREIESKLAASNFPKAGSSIMSKTLVCQCPACGSPLELKGKEGKGLYLRPYNSPVRLGYGLITAIGDAV